MTNSNSDILKSQQEIKLAIHLYSHRKRLTSLCLIIIKLNPLLILLSSRLQMNTLIQSFLKHLFVFYFLSLTLCIPANADSNEARAQAVSNSSKSNTLNSTVPNPAVTNWSINNLSPLAKEIADLAGISPILRELINEQNKTKSKELSLTLIAQRQKIIYLRNKLNALMQAINLQISATHGRIESAIAQADELRAYVTERRNRITRRNTQINLVSGGATKMSGYSIALAPTITPIPTDVLEIFDGAVQATLSMLAMREQQKEKKLEHGMPAILVSFLNDPQSSSAQFSPGIWMYLNHASPDNITNKTRREILIENWQKTGILPPPVSSSSNIKQPAKVNLLDQRLAMLSDLKSEVAEMNNGLMELSNAIALSYSSDPEF